MNEAISKMLACYGCRKAADDPRAMREILQGVVLLGLWRGRFFERAALCGGAALRLLYGLDRFEADLDFTLLSPTPGFVFNRYRDAVVREVQSLGFYIYMTKKTIHRASPLESAFLKTDTLQYALEITAIPEATWRRYTPNPPIRLRIEIDTNPPSGATVESRTCMLPIPFSVRTLAPPELLAMKLAALLTHRYYRQPKGRDWYDLSWCAAHQPKLNLAHLEARLRQTGWMPPKERPAGDGKQPGTEAQRLSGEGELLTDGETQSDGETHSDRESNSTGEGETAVRKGGVLTGAEVLKMAEKVIKLLDIEEARREVLPYLSAPGTAGTEACATAAWSPEFFREAVCRIVMGDVPPAADCGERAGRLASSGAFHPRVAAYAL